MVNSLFSIHVKLHFKDDIYLAYTSIASGFKIAILSWWWNTRINGDFCTKIRNSEFFIACKISMQIRARMALFQKRRQGPKIFIGLGNDVKTSISKFGLELMISNLFINILVVEMATSIIFWSKIRIFFNLCFKRSASLLRSFPCQNYGRRLMCVGGNIGKTHQKTQ